MNGWVKWSQKFGRSAKVYPRPLKLCEHDEAPELRGSVQGKDELGSAAWRQDRMGDRSQASAAPELGENVETAGLRWDVGVILWW